MKKRIRENVVTIVMMMLAIYCVGGAYQAKKQGEIFYFMGFKPIIILSGSMEPEIKTHSLVIVKQTKEIGVNDLVFFVRDDGMQVVHRCIEIDKEGELITKGDANEIKDFDSVPIKNVEGKVVLAMNWLSPLFDLFLKKVSIN